MDPLVQIHKPSILALNKAKADGIDLLSLKQTNPNEYKMRVAQDILLSSRELADFASQVFFAAFPHHELFKLDYKEHLSLLSFPELSPKDLKRWDDALSRLVLQTKFAKDYAYYRVVQDKQGEMRQLALPLSPQAYEGQLNVLVGPFVNELEAHTWGEQQFMFDTVAYLGVWFCDLFSVEM